MNSNLRVLVVSTDRPLLRQMALLLEQFGYEPVCYADVALALGPGNAGDCDFLIVDHDALDGEFARIEYAKRRRDRDHLQVYLLYRDLAELDIELAVESGVDDFLRKPLSSGEVLARLRAGARYCEFQRRNCRQQWHDPLTGLASRTALMEHLQQRLARRGRGRQASLAILELDLFENLVASQGQDLGNDVLCAVARVIEEACTAGQVVARLQQGRFAVMLPDHSVEKASKWAEQLRQSIGEMELAQLDPECRITASVGLAASAEVTAADDLLQRAEEALREAHCSGRNRLACYGEFDVERNAWDDLVQNGNPFQATVARDVMTPFTLTLQSEDTLDSAATMFARTRLEWLPVFDPRGGFAGIVERRAVDEWHVGRNQASVPISDAMHTVNQLPDTAPFSAVMDCFVRQDELVVVIECNDRPQGFVAREQFLALVRPVSAEMFAWSDDNYPSGTEFLVVPDAVAI